MYHKVFVVFQNDNRLQFQSAGFIVIAKLHENQTNMKQVLHIGHAKLHEKMTHDGVQEVLVLQFYMWQLNTKVFYLDSFWECGDMCIQSNVSLVRQSVQENYQSYSSQFCYINRVYTLLGTTSLTSTPSVAKMWTLPNSD